MRHQQYTILYVEEDVDIAELNITYFKSKGYLIEHATRGDEAIALCKAIKPDIVLLNVILQDQTGFDVLRSLHQYDINLPVIFLSSLNDTKSIVEGLKFGAVDYVHK